MSIERHHAEWLYFAEPSGPFLTVPVLERVFPQGLDALDKELVARLRLAHEEWTELDPTDQQASELHSAWIRMVLREALDYADGALLDAPSDLERWSTTVPEHGEALAPVSVLVDPGDGPDRRARVLITTWPRAQENLEATVAGSRWAVSPAERMGMLLRKTGVRLGLVTNGEQWILVWGGTETTGYAHWYSSLWFEEPVTLRSFVALLGARRFFSVPETDTLEAMLVESASRQKEVTEQLGAQVRKAVEVLVQALDRTDQDSGRTLLDAVTEQQIYEAAVTVMMRLVFLLSAEERGLLLLGDPIYDQQYAVSTLSGQLRREAARVGEEVLERRQDAWLRLLATFHAIHRGIQHESLRLPAYGGSLFDPDRYPFLEGRKEGSSWRDAADIDPLPVDNRTVLLLLESLQLLRGRGARGTTEAQRLSFRGLGIEQIGHVYEGLLDHQAVRLTAPALGLVGASGLEPELALPELEAEAGRGREALVGYLNERTERSESAIKRALESEPDTDTEGRLLVACRNDRALFERVRPYHALIRDDVWGYPVVYHEGSFAVIAGLDRRSTGTHYTERSLTEEIVQYALEPLVYEGPAEGRERSEWKLRPARELLDLRICDPAMGSGAFLVQVCRYLSERLMEAWDGAAAQNQEMTVDGGVVTRTAGEIVVPGDREDRVALARRLVAERCIYGVDVNPMAVEMAKLSIWLITLAKGRPFEFLDHALKPGDSLLGIRDLDQVRHLHPDPERGQELHLTLFDPRERVWHALDRAVELRKRVRLTLVIDARDAETKKVLSQEAEAAVARVKSVGDAVTAALMAWSNQGKTAVDEQLQRYGSAFAKMFAKGEQDTDALLAAEVAVALNRGKALLRPDRRAFHWPLEFPEVFEEAEHGFDAVVTNPPFLGGTRISELLGDTYNDYLKYSYAPSSKKADLCAYFLRRSAQVIRQGGTIGSLATNTIAQGITRKVGLEPLVAGDWTIFRARPSFPWPGSASVIAAAVWIRRGDWRGVSYVDNEPCRLIDALLTPQEADADLPRRLRVNTDICFDGSSILGTGFFLTPEQAKQMLDRDPRNREVVKPVIGGKELNNQPDLSPTRWVIDMEERGEDEAASYELPWRHLQATVRPIRLRKNPDKYPRLVKTWWRFWHGRQALYRGIRDQKLNRLLVRARVSDLHMMAFLPATYVYTEQLSVFLLDSWHHFGILQSTVHDVWARRFASTMKTDVRYIPTDCFESFPLPDRGLDRVARTAERYYTVRSELMLASRQGLTKLYNRFHDAACKDSGLQDLRSLSVELDTAVLEAYGWESMQLEHDFRVTPKGVRYTVSNGTRVNLLRQLRDVNFARAHE